MREVAARPASITDELVALEPHFNKQNAYALKFESECLFAKQQLLKNDYTLTAAQNNPAALRAAILNVAAIGISLNPALAHAYLVPRSPGSAKDASGRYVSKPAQVCLDISYRGLVKLEPIPALSTGPNLSWSTMMKIVNG